jgi:hypothetical protein
MCGACTYSCTVETIKDEIKKWYKTSSNAHTMYNVNLKPQITNNDFLFYQTDSDACIYIEYKSSDIHYLPRIIRKHPHYTILR